MGLDVMINCRVLGFLSGFIFGLYNNKGYKVFFLVDIFVKEIMLIEVFWFYLFFFYK